MRGNKRERAILYLVSSSLSNAAPFLVPSILSCEAEAQLSGGNPVSQLSLCLMETPI